MKYLKLYENFNDPITENNKKANEIVDDIKSIAYILEDEGFELKYEFLNRYKNIKGKFVSRDSINVDDYYSIPLKSIINSIEIKITGNTITNPITFQMTLTDKAKETIDKYIQLLKEHLDYIDPNNITTQKSLMGNTNIIININK